ncbi:hypothetical protein D3C80_1719790 [compost metagenome]
MLADPAPGNQWKHADLGGADFGIAQLAGAEMWALAHDHAHQQCLGFGFQRRELPDERRFFDAEQIAVTLADPAEGGAEIREVIKLGGQGGRHAS